MSGFDDLVNKGREALNSEQGEQISDQVLDGAAGAANRVTGDRFAEQVQQGRDAADGFVGTEGAAPGAPQGDAGDKQA